ncbi:MAG: hypothetical protein HQ559_14680, partial [Lentisphaerae bacterium]|nr:hypothetical protein [Lentisphaerota bacterium]
MLAVNVKKVLIPTKLDPAARDLLAARGEYDVVQDASVPLGEMAAKHRDAYALIVRSEDVTADIIDALPNLKVIVRAGSGFNTIDTKHARRKGIDVMNTPGANANAVAEEVIAMMLADARHIVEADASTRAGKWEKKHFMGREIAGKTVGIVGLGNVGQLVAKRLSGFDVRLMGHDPVISAERAQEIGVELTELKTLCGESDFITLHAPENEDTRGLFDAALFSCMKDGTTIVNCARAGIINEDDLRAARREKNIRFLNDVYPKDEAGKKTVEDVADLMLPHLGASTMEANMVAARRAAEQLIDFDQKGITSFIVNRDIPEGLDEAFCELASILSRLCRCIVGRETTPTIIETSFYGSLEPFADWLLVPIVAGIWDEFDRSMDFRGARQYMEEMGIEYTNRKADPGKRFANSMTVDLTCAVDSATLRRVSIRGTVAENIAMVSRVNEFDKLYFEPAGNTMFFVYDDRPGVVGTIGQRLAEAKINIEDMRHSHDRKTNRSL